MHIFGLTGGVASGKSTVAGWFREAGVPVVDADELARLAVAPGQPVLKAIAEHFGAEVLDAAGGLLRGRLAKLVFADPAALKTLNALTHPEIGRLAHKRFRELEASGVELAGYEVPLLYEQGLQSRYHPVVVVYVDPETQLARAQARSGWTEAQARERVAAQLPMKSKAERADYVIDASQGLAETRANALNVLAALRADLGLAAHGPEPEEGAPPRQT